MGRNTNPVAQQSPPQEQARQKVAEHLDAGAADW